MSHHKYHTPGIILSSLPSGEANSFLYIFTRDLGLIGAYSQGSRNLSSKLRYGLQDFSHSLFSLISTKKGWKVVSARPLGSYFSAFKNQKEKLILSARTASLLRRLLGGEENNTELFDLIVSAFDSLAGRAFNHDELHSFECLLMLRILNNLGYIGETPTFASLLAMPLWSQSELETIGVHRREAIKTINRSLEETQM